MTEEIKEELKKLQEEIAKLKEQLNEKTAKEENRRHGIYIDVGSQIRNYMDDVMESVAEGIEGELEKSVFIGPRHHMKIIRSKGDFKAHCGPAHLAIHHREHEEPEEPEVSISKVAETMSALGQEHRLKILKELASGGKYINELQEKLPEITASTLSSHLDVLEEAGFVVQEKVRGRYLITMPGRAAFKMAMRITRFIERREQE
ncbi:MAG: helix-turn-helix domain-containing protein [Candidatus Bathyarchaeia archaeon]